MSFFGRAANLIKGGIKSVGRGGDESAAKERALAEELARMERAARPAPIPNATPVRPGGGASGRVPDPPGTPPAPERGPPERDEHGNVKRTL